MLSFANFSSKIILDLNKTFPKARLEGKYVVVESEPNSVSIPVSSIYREYQEVKDYRKTLKLYVDIINDILNQYKFKIDYNSVYPFLKSTRRPGGTDGGRPAQLLPPAPAQLRRPVRRLRPAAQIPDAPQHHVPVALPPPDGQRRGPGHGGKDPGRHGSGGYLRPPGLRVCPLLH